MHPSTTDSDELLRPATEQEALRRIATLVARAAPPAEIYEALTTEVGRLMPSGDANLLRFEGGGMATMIGRWNEFDGYLSIGARLPVGTGTLAQLISESGSPSRIASYTESTGPLADMIRGWGWRSSVGAPVIVDAKVWGLTAVGSRIDRELPAGTEHRLAAFTELLAHAIANAQSRAELEQLAREQAALRRVAELVARGVDHDELFASVATESSQLIDGHPAVLVRRGRPAGWTVVAARGGLSGVASRLVSGDDDGDAGVLACVSRTGRTARVDDLGVRSDVGVPIFLSTRLWGVLVITSRAGPLPGTVERRLEEFAGLITAALANAQARTEVEELAAEQAALLRVAERVARGDPPAAVFEAVAAEAQQLLGGQPITLVRFEEDDELVVVSHSGGLASPGARWRYAPRTLPDRVRRAGRPGRVDDYRLEPDADLAESLGTVAAVAAPVHVESRVWGMFTATSADGPLAAGVEDRLRRFAGLVGTAISNATSRAQLIASRARVLSTADETRRQLQRDVHDGAQQRLVQTVITLKLAGQSLAQGDVAGGAERVAEGLMHAQRATDELRELVRGILPSGLTRKGLRGGVDSLVSDLPLHVDASVDVPRLSPELETTAYFLVAEALTNVVKHADAERAWVNATVHAGVLRIEVGDDGVGGARAEAGSGLTGLFDRVEARGGRLRVDSPVGEGTTIEATVPV